MSNCEQYFSIFKELIKNEKNKIVYDRKHNEIIINKITKLTENIEPQFGRCNFDTCLKSYIKINKYTGSIYESHFDNTVICEFTMKYENGLNTLNLGYNHRTKQFTFL